MKTRHLLVLTTRKIILLFASALLISCSSNVVTSKSTATDDQSKADDRIFPMPYLLETLDNGLTVMIVKTDYPDIVNLQLPVQTGSRNEVELGKSGFAHFFEHMMFRGTENYSAEEYTAMIKNAGADQNAYTTDDYTNYHTTFTKSDLETMLKLEADRFMNLSYTEEQFRTEALAVKGEYLKNSSNPISKIFEVIRASSFKTHTYGHTTMGFLKDIEDMPNQLDYSKVFFDRWYRPEKSALILVGDLDPKNTLKLIKKYFGPWERGTYVSDIPVEAAPSGPAYEHIPWETPTQPWYVVAFRGPAFDPSKKEMPTMDVLSSLYLSQSSALYQKLVVEERLVDQFFPYFPDRKDPNLLMIGARLTDGANAGAVRDAINQTIATARSTKVSLQKLEETKSRLRYQFASGLDNSEAIGDLLASYMQFEKDPETINNVYQQYASVTPDDVVRYANNFFVDQGKIEVTLANSDTMVGFNPNASLEQLTANFQPQGTSSDNDASAALEQKIAQWSLGASSGNKETAKFLAQPSASSPLIDVSLVFNTGAAHDPVGKKGLAALTAAMLTDASSQAFTYEQINQAMYPLAAGFNAQVDKHMTTLRGTVHRDNLDKWYTLVLSQLLRPAWDEDDLARIKTRVVNGIRTDLVGNNDEELGKEVLYASIYGENHPYGSFNGGNSDDVQGITIEDIKGFYAQHFGNSNLTVGLSGGYPADFSARLRRDLKHLPQGTANSLKVDQVALEPGRRALIVEKDTQAVAVSFGFPIDIQRGDKDWVALWLARSWLGEHRNTSAHLFGRIREERGMNYGDYAYIEYFPRGMFLNIPDANLVRQQQIFQVWIRPLRTNNDAHFATRVAMYELQKMIDNGMSEEDFNASKNFLEKFVSLLVKTQSRQLGYALDSEYYGIGPFTEYVRDELRTMTVNDVNRAIAKHLQTKDMQFVFIAKDAAGLSQALSSDQSSPISYNSPKPELEAEDKIIADLPLNIVDIEIISGEEIFK